MRLVDLDEGPAFEPFNQTPPLLLFRLGGLPLSRVLLLLTGELGAPTVLRVALV
jgi:hypothetical protein